MTETIKMGMGVAQCVWLKEEMSVQIHLDLSPFATVNVETQLSWVQMKHVTMEIKLLETVVQVLVFLKVGGHVQERHQFVKQSAEMDYFEVMKHARMAIWLPQMDAKIVKFKKTLNALEQSQYVQLFVGTGLLILEKIVMTPTR